MPEPCVETAHRTTSKGMIHSSINQVFNMKWFIEHHNPSRSIQGQTDEMMEKPYYSPVTHSDLLQIKLATWNSGWTCPVQHPLSPDRGWLHCTSLRLPSVSSLTLCWWLIGKFVKIATTWSALLSMQTAPLPSTPFCRASNSRIHYKEKQDPCSHLLALPCFLISFTVISRALCQFLQIYHIS